MNYQLMRKARKIAKITQDDLASLLGINRATISKYETGVIEPPTAQQVKIAQILDIDLFELLDDKAIQAYLDANERKDNVLDRSGILVDQEGATAPMDSYIGQFMKAIKNLDSEGKLDLLVLTEYFVETNKEDQKQLLRFAAFLTSHPKYKKAKDPEIINHSSDATNFIRAQLLSLMQSEDTEPKEEE